MEKQKRKELLEAYKQQKTMMGVVSIKNKTNGKLFVMGFPNLKNKWASQRAQLEMGRHMNLALQKDWNELGPSAFSYEVLEEKSTEDMLDVRYEVRQMEAKWLEKLKPFGEHGYNKAPAQ